MVPLVVRLERRGVPPLAATWLVLLALVGSITAVLVVVPAFVREANGLDTELTGAVDDVEDWLVDGPLAVDRSSVRDLRAEAGDRASRFLASSPGQLASGAVAVGEVLAGAVLALVLAFLLTKDGRRFQEWVLARFQEWVLPTCHRGTTSSSVPRRWRAWHALGGYLRAAALLGVVEGAIIGVTMAVVGADLALAVAVVTFLAAFFPIVGAIVAGAIAVLVTPVSAGTTQALVVLAVAVVVQQLDDDFLAPVVYGVPSRCTPRSSCSSSPPAGVSVA